MKRLAVVAALAATVTVAPAPAKAASADGCPSDEYGVVVSYRDPYGAIWLYVPACFKKIPIG